jgi:hypothetical protein
MNGLARRLGLNTSDGKRRSELMVELEPRSLKVAFRPTNQDGRSSRWTAVSRNFISVRSSAGV